MKKAIFGGFLLLSGCILKVALLFATAMPLEDDVFFHSFSLLLIAGGLLLGFFGIVRGNDS